MDGERRDMRALRGEFSPASARPAYAGQSARLRIVRPTLPSRRFIGGGLVRLAEYFPKGLGSSLAIGFFVASIAFGLYRGGHVDAFAALYGDPRQAFARFIGLQIETVTISGLSELQEQDVLHVAGVDPKESMPFVDVEMMRANLLALPLVKDVTVQKFYPNSLSIAIVEREPFALWQRNGEVFVIAADGRVIDQLRDEVFAGLPLVVGEGAAERAQDFVTLLNGVPEVKPLVRAGIFVGQRRWSLKLNNGLDVILPEDRPAAALARFSAVMREQKILDKDIISIDLRMPDRVVLRLTEEAAAMRADILRVRVKGKAGSV